MSEFKFEEFSCANLEAYYGERKDINMGKLISKIPMCNKVVDDNYVLWEYWIADGKLVFYKIGHLLMKSTEIDLNEN